MSNCRIYHVDPFRAPEWDRYVNQHPEGNLFHSTAWAKVLLKSYPQLEPRYLMAKDAHGTVQGVFPLLRVQSFFTGTRLVSLPFTLHAGPLTSSSHCEQALVQSALEIARLCQVNYLEIRSLQKEMREREFKPVSNYVTHFLELTDNPEQLLKKFSRSNVRQHIGKLKNLPLTVRRGTDKAAVNIFYQLYLHTRKRIGLPPQPFDFFMEINNQLVARDLGAFYLLYYQKKPIASVLALFSRHQYRLEYSGTDYRYQHAKPMIALFWHIIQEAAATGKNYVEFGGSPRSHHSLRRFKNHWGAIEKPIYHFFYPEVQGISGNWQEKRGHRFVETVFKHTPKKVLPGIGKMIYRHLGG